MTRPRAPYQTECCKARHRSPEKAHLAISGMRKEGIDTTGLGVYRCGYCKKWWHVGHGTDGGE